ncbi:MAG: ABC transporter permease subunit [Alphaproteobacteria bacterium]|jgi:spermidine/putrescine transport system permease protein|nr:ABC transporter permease subunit [Alphaproteobacteria bacterium]MBN8522393.1 ABC transporter permease subunit [Rickettsiales bacterium]
MMNKDLFKHFTILTIVAWLTVFVLIPNIGVVVTSFLEREEAHFVSFTFTLDNYKKLLSVMYIKVFLKSLAIALYVTILCLVFSYPFVYTISQTIKSIIIKDFLLILVIIPFWTSSLIRTYAMMIVLRSNGLLNNFLMYVGLIDEPIELLYNWVAVTIGLVYSLLPFMILPLYTAFEKLDRNYINAAQDLGAGKIDTLLKIIIPLTKSGIAAGCILVFLSTLGMFFIPELLGGSKEILVGNLIKNQFLIARDWPFGTAIGTVLTVIVVILMVIYARNTKNTDQLVV